eukprot:753000-Hanusia_phi.AAC.5
MQLNRTGSRPRRRIGPLSDSGAVPVRSSDPDPRGPVTVPWVTPVARDRDSHPVAPSLHGPTGAAANFTD